MLERGQGLGLSPVPVMGVRPSVCVSLYGYPVIILVPSRTSPSGMKLNRATRDTAQPCWERQGAHFLFHFTQPDHADAIFAEQRFLVPERRGSQGWGLYVTNIKPGSRPDDFILKTLFALGRDQFAIEGVVVLSHDALPFRRVAPHSFFHAAPAGATLDLVGMLVGSGRRNRGTWRWTSGIFS